LRCKEVGIGSVITEKKRVIVRFSGTHLPQENIRPLARNFLQYDFHPDHVAMILAETPQKMLENVENIVEALAKAFPDKSQEARVGVSTGMAPKRPRAIRALRRW
jgi:hypothetical protein